MTNFKNLYMKIKEKFARVSMLEDTKKHKMAKIISFLLGTFFDLFGVLLVAIWKYLFCNKEENSRYCIRLSMFGMILKFLVCSKMLFTTNLPFFTEKKQNVRKIQQHGTTESLFDDDFFTFSIDIDKEINKINQRFQKMNEIFDRAMAEQEKEMQQITSRENKDSNVKKEVKIENGYKTTTLEKTSPRSYTKSVSIRYVGNNGDVENDKPKKDIIKHQKRPNDLNKKPASSK